MQSLLFFPLTRTTSFLNTGGKGRGSGIDAAISNKGGLGTSFIFAFSKGVLLNVEVSDAMLKAATDVNTNTYGGNVTCEDIVHGKVPMPDGKQGELIKSLHDKLAEHTEGKHAEEAAEESNK